MRIKLFISTSLLLLIALPNVVQAQTYKNSVKADTSNPSYYHQRIYEKIPEPAYSKDDVDTEVVFGRELAAKILGKYPPLKDKKLNEYVNKVGEVIAQQSDRPELTYHFIVVNTDIINAFSAPGGYVFITKGAIDQMDDESELAAVIAHEIGHIELRHYVKKVGLRSTKGKAEDDLSAILSGGDRAAMQAFNEALDETMEILFNKGLQSKKDEFGADQTAVFLLANAGYDPTALERYFKKIEHIHNNETEILAETHPPLDERITKMDQLLKQNGMDTLKLAKLKERFDESK